MIPEPSARRFIVSGRVQGVGFRFFAVRCARRLGVSGWVRNLPDGRVEVLAEGSEPAVAGLREELRRGPSGARVSDLEETVLPAGGAETGFDVRF